MRETRVRFLGWEGPLEKEMVIYSSTLAWKIPWTEEPDRLQSMGSQRVGHDWVTSHSLSGQEICRGAPEVFSLPPGRLCCFLCQDAAGMALPWLLWAPGSHVAPLFTACSSYLLWTVWTFSVPDMGSTTPSYWLTPITEAWEVVFYFSPSLGLLVNWPDLCSQQGPRIRELKD